MIQHEIKHRTKLKTADTRIVLASISGKLSAKHRTVAALHLERNFRNQYTTSSSST